MSNAFRTILAACMVVVVAGDVSAVTASGAPRAAIELPSIASEFDVATELFPAWGSGNIPPSAAPDVVGAFRFICSAGQINYDDPIVHPGQSGASHLHQFFGNLEADANSTYASLRKSGESTCNNRLNRSAYWMPAMLNGRGKVVKPSFVTIYYKRLPGFSPACAGDGQEPKMVCRALPRGLRFVFGHDMLNKTGKKTGNGYFDCQGPTAKRGPYPDIVSAAENCPPGNQLGAIINAPNCWDGMNLDSPDHRKHVSYKRRNNQGKAGCPKSHPYIIPAFTLGAWYDTDETLDGSGKWDPQNPSWHLSSDRMPGMKPARPGTTFHSDWLGAWDDEVMAQWMAHCINRMLNCSGGDLGNGKQMKMTRGYGKENLPRIVDVPHNPRSQQHGEHAPDSANNHKKDSL